MDPNPCRSACLENGTRSRRSGFRSSSPCLGPRHGRWRGVFLSLLLCAILSVVGCSHGNLPPLGRVHGKVTLNGKPLASALVVFHPAKGHISCATTDGDGNYDLIFIRQEHGVLVGKHRVEVSTQPPEDFRKEIVPAHYNSKTTLEEDVVAGENEIDLDLTSS